MLYSFSGGADGKTPNAGVVRDAHGHLYGATVYGGGADYASLTLHAAGHLCGVTSQGGASSEGLVFTVNPSGGETILYQFPGP